MIRLWSILFALAVAYAVTLAVTAVFDKATAQFSGNASGPGPSDFELSHSTSLAGGAQPNHGS